MALSQLDDRSQKAGPSVNPARVFERAVRYWYVFVVMLVLTLSAAWMINRYTTRVYRITASVVLRESDENIGAKILYGSTFGKSLRNYRDELIIMKSIPLLQQVVQKLGIEVTYHADGEIKQKEWYLPDLPVRMIPAAGKPLPYGRAFRIRFSSEQQFDWAVVDAKGEPVGDWATLTYGDSVTINDSRFCVCRKEFAGQFPSIREFIVKFHDPSQVAAYYSSVLELNWSQTGSGTIDMAMRTIVPDKDIAFMVSFIEYYQAFDIERRSQIYTKSVQFLDRQIDVIRDSLQFYEAKMTGLSVSRGDAEAGGRERIVDAARKVEEQEMQMQLQQRYFSYLEDYLNQGSDLTQVLLPAALGVSDPVLAGLVGNLSKLQSELRMMQKQLKAGNNPLVLQTQEKIEAYKRDLAEGIKGAREIMQLNKSFYQDRQQALEKEFRQDKDPVDARYKIYDRNYKLNEGLYTFITQKRAEAALSKASTTSDVMVIGNPKAGAPISPVPLTNYTYALVLGLLVPLAWCIVLEFFNNKVQSKEDIESVSQVPVIGTIGHNKEDTNLAVAAKPRSYLAESYRALRQNLNYFMEGKERKVLMVTSSISGEGKTFTSINLATVMAFSGKRTILVAGDMRKHQIVKDFGVSNRQGLSLVLSGQATIEEVTVRTSIENLDFIPPGPTPPNPAELYLGPRTGELIAALQQQYDYVVFDTPPVGLVSDALSLIGLVDHVLFVTRQGYTPLSAVNQLQFMVDQGQLEHVSVVLNDIVKVGMGYGYKYGYAYDYGYGYRYGHNRYYGQSTKEYGYEDDAYS